MGVLGLMPSDVLTTLNSKLVSLRSNRAKPPVSLELNGDVLVLRV